MNLAQRIDAMWERRGEDYRPRTRHLDSQGRPRFTNRLFLETSPYLLQHAHNPVDWYAWGTRPSKPPGAWIDRYCFPSAIPPVTGAT